MFSQQQHVFTFLVALALAALLGGVSALSVDNGVEGEPEIECGPQAITVNFNTKNPFEGHVFVKGLFKSAECRNDDGGNRVAGINLPFDSCQTRRTRSLNPRGVYISTTVVITFHPQFITMVDKAYKIQCFYMEADKSVSADLEVSMLTTGFQTQLVPMPVCRYEILEGGAAAPGDPVQFVFVGQTVYHKWTCDTETSDTFCMTVHSCYVDDGQGDRVDLLDPEGCAQDRYLLNNLVYMTDLMAGQETMVFKYADRPQLFFQCQISITIKEPTQECPRATCATPARGKRYAVAEPRRSLLDTIGVLDVSTQIESIDLDQSTEEYTSELRDLLNHSSGTVSAKSLGAVSSAQFCLSHMGFAMLIGLLGLVLVSAFLVITVLCLRKQ